jgi:hypothetical protein
MLADVEATRDTTLYPVVSLKLMVIPF